ncbi:Acetoin utilization deacetylase AcuC [Arboricoccus pini]|uniref:Acetoin utilization deacetylase AcuC n=1 Tax=Arboricoccus pini TaxID=1963835 RepID=A0A212QUK1_9PROT|nr:histone deacetylase [Arboricoccus pini]SNB63174.1 Acetoin utilization deacetylase AcuC [Arboricoccus pini]
MLPIVFHPDYSIPLPAGHRFPMPKFVRLFERLQELNLARRETLFTPEPAPRAWLETVHDPAYVTAILEQRLSRQAERILGLPLSPMLARRSQAAVAGTLLAARLALDHRIACNTAGGSHHAYRDFGSGYCVFNDVAVAATMLLDEGSVRRVLVIDLDVHQGDGTAAILASDPRAWTFSIHCRQNFPVHKQQSDLDVSLDKGADDDCYMATLEAVLPALLARLRPDLAFYVAGVDPHVEDRLGRLALSDAGLRRRDRFVIESCLRQGIPLAGTLGGGYATDMRSLAARHAILFEEAAMAVR